MDYSQIRFEVSDDHVATLTIDRPERMNTFTDEMHREFVDAWREVRENDAIHAVVLRANRESRAFSTGVDVNAGMEIFTHANVWRQSEPRLGPKQNDVWKPVVCAVHGLAAGGAFYWINEADVVICSDDAHFFDPHVTFGMVAAAEPIGLTRRAPLGDVLRIALMGNDERVSAETALRIGLVSEIVPAETLHERAHEIAAIIARKPSAATQGTVRAIWDSLDVARSVALGQATRYWQVGNPIAQSAVDRSAMGRSPWALR